MEVFLSAGDLNDRNSGSTNELHFLELTHVDQG